MNGDINDAAAQLRIYKILFPCRTYKCAMPPYPSNVFFFKKTETGERRKQHLNFYSSVETSRYIAVLIVKLIGLVL